MNITAMLGRLSPYRGNVQTATNRQGTNDIIKEIEKCHNEYAGEYDKIADQFSKGDAAETAATLWRFLKKNVKYSVEPADRQSVKSPAAILASGKYKSGNDCKHYALFTGGVLDALRRRGKDIDFVYRFVNYRLLESDPQHVFIVVKYKGREIWIDPVLQRFNEKKPYINGIDKKIKSGKMPVYKISGIEENDDFEVYGMPTIGRRPRRTKEQKKAVRTERKEKRKVRKQEKGSLFSRTIVRGGLVVPRNSFLKLVALNALNLAVKLNDKAKNPEVREKMRTKWMKLGGKPDVLFKNIARGISIYKRKNPAYIGVPIFSQSTLQAINTAAQEAQGLKGQRGVKSATKGAGIAAGAASAVLAASNPVTAGLIASAGAIIAAMGEFIGKEPKQALDMVAETLPPEQRAEIATQAAETKVMTATGPAGGSRPAAGPSGAPEAAPERPGAGQQAFEEQPGPESTGTTGGINKNLLIFGGVAIAALFLMRKK
jgi:hypothetical protein